MIWESGPWKLEIFRLAMALRRRKGQKQWRQESHARLEQEVFFAAYAVRKLIDAYKISDEVESLSLDAKAFPRRERAPDLMNWHRVDELFDSSVSTKCRISLKDFCNQVIHSFVFISCVDEESQGLCGLLLASDRQKDESILYFDIDQVIDRLLAVAHDDIVRAEYVRSGVGEPVRVVMKSNRHLEDPSQDNQ